MFFLLRLTICVVRFVFRFVYFRTRQCRFVYRLPFSLQFTLYRFVPSTTQSCATLTFELLFHRSFRFSFRLAHPIETSFRLAPFTVLNESEISTVLNDRRC